MATLASVVKNERRAKLAKKFLDKRIELKKVVSSQNASDSDKVEAMRLLQKMPRNSSPTRVRNRCSETGRARAFLRKFGLSRIKFRELALRGMIPGITKSSW
jgi:small subunit ribosomal protein S14